MTSSLFVSGTCNAAPIQGKLQRVGSPLPLGQPLKHQPLSAKSRGTEGLKSMLWLILLRKRDYCLGIAAQVQLCCSLFCFTSDFQTTLCLVFNPCFSLLLLLDLPKSRICCLCKTIIKQLFAAVNTEGGKNISVKNIRDIPTFKGRMSQL